MKAYDLETTGLTWLTDDITLIGCADGVGARELTLSSFTGEGPGIWQNGKFDYKCLKRKGIDIYVAEDTLILASLLPIPEEVHLNLEGLAAHYLHYKPWKIDWKKETSPPRERVLEHCLNDCKATLELYKVLLERVKETGQERYYYRYLMPFHRLLMDVEYHGIRVDFGRALKLQSELVSEVEGLQRDIRGRWGPELEAASIEHHLMKVKPPVPELYYEHKDKGVKSEKQYARLKDKEGWVEHYDTMPSKTLKFDLEREQIKSCPPTLNLDSHAQLRTFLSVLGVFLTDREGKPTTNKHEMEYHIGKHPVLKDILVYRDKVKQLSFLESWEKFRHGDRIHTNYNIAGRSEGGGKWKRGTRTGRLSSSEPNLQQVDKRMRELFIPDEGYVFVGGDFSQIEMRLIAHFCEDNKMRDTFRKGIDFYGQVAKDMFGLSCKANAVKEEYPDKRFVAKTISLAIPYGMWAGTLSYRAKLAGLDLSEDEARDHLNEWYNIFRGVRPYKARLGTFALQNGYVRSIYGRKIWIPREEAEHKALDYRCQSSGHEMTAFPQIAVQEEVKDFAQSTFWLHDETWYNCKNDEKSIDTLKSIMRYNMVDRQQALLKLTVPLDIDIEVISNLGEKK